MDEKPEGWTEADWAAWQADSAEMAAADAATLARAEQIGAEPDYLANGRPNLHKFGIENPDEWAEDE